MVAPMMVSTNGAAKSLGYDGYVAGKSTYFFGATQGLPKEVGYSNTISRG